MRVPLPVAGDVSMDLELILLRLRLSLRKSGDDGEVAHQGSCADVEIAGFVPGRCP